MTIKPVGEIAYRLGQQEQGVGYNTEGDTRVFPRISAAL